MITVRQLEALAATVRLRTLAKAALHLNTAQPTISKRLQELEAACHFKVFEKSGRTLRLTEKGQVLYKHAELILGELDKIQKIRAIDHSIPQSVSIGVTEISAHTWLPSTLEGMLVKFPAIVPNLTVDHSIPLMQRLQRGELMVVVCQEMATESMITSIPLQTVHFALAGSSRLFDENRIYSGDELSRFTFLSHGATGSILALSNWMRYVGIQPRKTMQMDSLVALIGVACAGMGITLIPRDCFGSFFKRGLLREIKTHEKELSVMYRVYFSEKAPTYPTRDVAEFIRETCDLTVSFEQS